MTTANLNWPMTMGIETPVGDMPEIDQVLDGLPVITDTALYEFLFGDNIPMNQAVTIEKGQRWMGEHRATHAMLSDNRAIAAASAKRNGRSCLVILRPDSPFIAPAPRLGKC